MLDLRKIQQEIYNNKIAKGFNTTDINQEFCYLHQELAEAYDAYYRKKPDIGEELADVAIYILGLAEILKIDLEKEIVEKNEKNRKREYKVENGVATRIKEAE